MKNKNILVIILGIFLLIIGAFIIISGFQASSCQLENVCLGLKPWCNLWNYDNAFVLGLFVAAGLSSLLLGFYMIINNLLDM